MSKILKRIIIGSCICIVVGFILFIGAAAAGGLSDAKEIMDNGGITIGFSSEDMKGYNTATEENISLADMDRPELEMDLGAGNFEIIESDVKDIVVKSSKNIEISKDGDTIRIRTPKQFQLMKFSIMNSGNKVTIEIPEAMEFEAVKMKIGAGEMLCENIAAEKLRMEIGAGSISVDRFTSKKAVISVGAGEIIVAEGIAEDMDIDVGMGSLNLNGKVEDNLDADCGMGSVQLFLEGSQEEHDYDIDCGMGSVIVGDVNISGVSAEREIKNGSSSEFDIDCGMGSLEIHFDE